MTWLAQAYAIEDKIRDRRRQPVVRFRIPRADGRPPDLATDHGEKEPGHKVGIDVAHFAGGDCSFHGEADLLPGRRATAHQLRPALARDVVPQIRRQAPEVRLPGGEDMRRHAPELVAQCPALGDHGADAGGQPS